MTFDEGFGVVGLKARSGGLEGWGWGEGEGGVVESGLGHDRDKGCCQNAHIKRQSVYANCFRLEHGEEPAAH